LISKVKINMQKMKAQVQEAIRSELDSTEI